MLKNTIWLNASSGEHERKLWVVLSEEQKEDTWEILERKLYDYKNELSSILEINSFEYHDIYNKIKTNTIQIKLDEFIKNKVQSETDIFTLIEYWISLGKISCLNSMMKRYFHKRRPHEIVRNRIKQIVAHSDFNTLVQTYNDCMIKYYSWNDFTEGFFKSIHDILVSEFEIAIVNLEPTVENYNLLSNFQKKMNTWYDFNKLADIINNCMYTIMVKIYRTITDYETLLQMIDNSRRFTKNTDYQKIVNHLYRNVLKKNWEELNDFESLVTHHYNYWYYWWNDKIIYNELNTLIKNVINKEKKFKVLQSYRHFVSPERDFWEEENVSLYPEIFSMVETYILSCFKDWTIELDQSDIDWMNNIFQNRWYIFIC